MGAMGLAGRRHRRHRPDLLQPEIKPRVAQFPLGPLFGARSWGRAPAICCWRSSSFTSLSSCGRFAGSSSCGLSRLPPYGFCLSGQILGFSSIFLVGRPGELVRPAYIAKKENVPMSAMIAIWLLERVLDIIAMVVLFAAAIYSEPVNPDTAQGVSRCTRCIRGGTCSLDLRAC